MSMSMSSEESIPGVGLLLSVSDGIGGCNAGEIASALALTSLQRQLQIAPADLADPDGFFLSALHSIDQTIRTAGTANPERAGMGATLTALWLRTDGAWLGQIGDSRLYRLRDGRLRQLSPEHSPVGRMRLSGQLTEEEARRHRFKNVIDQSLGGDAATFEPEVLPLDLGPGDIVLLCSDGLTDGLRDAELTPTLLAVSKGLATPAIAVQSLIDAAKAASGRDNITALVASLY
jgi:protein phosphatase